MQAIIYTRFSPRRNADESESCEAQESYCRAYCKKAGYEVKAVYADRIMSGGDEDRPGLWQAVNETVKGVVLVAHKADRLARSVYLDEIIHRMVTKNGGTIEIVDGKNGGEPQDVLIRQVLAAFAEYERKVIAARTRAAMLYHQSQGRRMGRFAPYGWDIDPKNPAKLKKNTVEQDVIEQIKNMAGKRPQFIAEELNRQGVPARCPSGEWTRTAVHRILKRL